MKVGCSFSTALKKMADISSPKVKKIYGYATVVKHIGKIACQSPYFAFY
jgi:hypothetical protein